MAPERLLNCVPVLNDIFSIRGLIAIQLSMLYIYIWFFLYFRIINFHVHFPRTLTFSSCSLGLEPTQKDQDSWETISTAVHINYGCQLMYINVMERKQPKSLTSWVFKLYNYPFFVKMALLTHFLWELQIVMTFLDLSWALFPKALKILFSFNCEGNYFYKRPSLSSTPIMQI